MRFLALLVCLACPAISGCDDPTGEGSKGPPAVRVDFSAPATSVPSMVGLLHGFDFANPADSLITPLRSRFWRSGSEVLPAAAIERADRLGMRRVLVLSDARNLGYPIIGWTPPYSNYAQWEDFVRQTARATRGQGFIYDIWNEPDTETFWVGTDEQFFETFRRAERILRQELGAEAVIAGPGFADWNEARIAAFLDRALAAGVRIDVLAWHEFHQDPTIPRIADHVRTARARFMNSRRYAALGIKELHVHEVGTESAQFRPGSALANFHYLEQGGADGALRACWGEPEGNSCFNRTLNGLLNTKGERRSIWWAYQAYATTLDGRIPSESTDESFVAFATRGAGGTPARVVVGHYGRVRDTGALDLTLDLSNVSALLPAGSTQVRVVVRSLPNTGGAPLASMPILQELVLDATAATINVGLPAIPVFEGRVIDLLPMPAARSR